MTKNQSATRTEETIERCVDLAMQARGEILDGLLVVTEKQLRHAQVNMIALGICGDFEIRQTIAALEGPAVENFMTPIVAAADVRLAEMQESITSLCRPLRHIQRDVIVAALAEWDRIQAEKLYSEIIEKDPVLKHLAGTTAAKQARLQLCDDCERPPGECDCGRFEREG